VLRRAVVCVAFATWCFLNTWVELAQGQAPYYARWSPLHASLPAVLAWQVAIAVALFGAWELGRRRRLMSAPLAGAGFLILSLAPVGIAGVALLRAAPFDLVPLVRGRWFWPLVLAGAAPLAVLGLRRPARAAAAAQALFLYSCPVLALIAVQAGRATLFRYPTGAYRNGPLAPRSNQPPAPIRVVWIVFDELSEAIVFSHRPPGLELPNFDRLRARSFYATAARAPAAATQESLPALILGEPVSRSEPRGPRSLILYTPSHPAGAEWGDLLNVFDRARALGYDAALAGWFHPYGRLLHRSLVACDWTAGLLLSGVEEPLDPRPLAAAMAERARWQIATLPLVGHLPGYFPREVQREAADARFQYLLRRSRALAVDPSVSLVFLHLPVPHPPAIYRRDTRQFSHRGPGNYLDSVALADWTLGQLTSAIRRAGLEERTTLVVGADHGWRSLWRGGPDWTDEEEAASRGIDTMGVPFLVELPGAKEKVTYTRPFNTVVTAGLVLEILQARVRTPAEVGTWLSER
jgi:hypothetical protein